MSTWHTRFGWWLRTGAPDPVTGGPLVDPDTGEPVEVHPSTVAVGLWMAQHANWRTGCGIRVPLSTITELSGTAPATAKRARQLLVRVGWFELVIRPAPKRLAEYRATVPELGSRVSPVEARSAGNGDHP